MADNSANKLLEEAQANYLQCTQELCRETESTVISFAWDATVLSFSEMVFMAIYVSNVAFWCPPIVPSRILAF